MSEEFGERIDAHIKWIGERRLRIGSWHMPISDWTEVVLGLVIAGPFILAAVVTAFIVAIVYDQNPGGTEGLYGKIYWWVYAPAFLMYFLMAKDALRSNTISTEWKIEEEEEERRKESIRQSESYKFKMRHIKSLKKYVGNQRVKELEEEIFEGI